jgi:hypothetical protein
MPVRFIRSEAKDRPFYRQASMRAARREHRNGIYAR